MKELFKKNEFNYRRKRLKDILISQELDVVLLFSRAEIFYYSGIGLDGVLLQSKEELIFYVRRNLNLAREVTDLPVKKMESFRLFKELGSSLTDPKVGLELDILPYKTFEYIIKAFNPKEVIDVSTQLRKIRSKKSKAEIDFMKKSATQTIGSFDYLNDRLMPGMTEIEISLMAESYLRMHGHPNWVQVRAFQHNLTNLSVVTSGENAVQLNSYFGPISGNGCSNMHLGGASTRKIRKGDTLIVDTTGVYEGYITDVTRTFFIGKVDPKLQEAYNIAAEVQMKCANLLKPGASPSSIYDELETFVKESGFLERFMGVETDRVKFIGHGVGLELDEFPIITGGYKFPLEIGNTIAVEPKFIFPGLKQAVGIEETWLVTPTGGEILSNYQYNLNI